MNSVMDEEITAPIVVNATEKKKLLTGKVTSKVAGKGDMKLAVKQAVKPLMNTENISGGRVCLDNLKQFLSDRLFCLMPLPASEIVYSSKPHPVSFGQGFDAGADNCRIQSIP
jgi:hypothetical protein